MKDFGFFFSTPQPHDSTDIKSMLHGVRTESSIVQGKMGLIGPRGGSAKSYRAKIGFGRIGLCAHSVPFRSILYIIAGRLCSPYKLVKIYLFYLALIHFPTFDNVDVQF